ncbi:hypothetical protein C6P46_001894 [Rhodotorula mucilaginosa]|uniref:RING-type E3 ubiquitin transferase n=1 Tax=Rhodotorula mucilaginosa TaxID=5537 RepID=A0A9P7B8H6_RHOMI|nr:hypothetical protein C6P46_001894 [Rhodotorula mucilaginosa]TKA56463.1 hypothetical protein B0A53_02034 [Rhodotorula sp. CCFEE 5036]
MSTSASPSQPAASHDDDSPSDPPALAARQPGPAISEGPSSTTAVHSTSDPSSSPSQGPPRLESGADDPSSVIDPKDAASLQLPSNHAGKSKEQEEDKLDRFSCHICLEVPDEPVVSPCGHLYCWPCMHEWLVVAHGRACPVCKAVLTVNQLVPIYTSAEAVDPRSRPIPPRPRPAAPPPPAPSFRAPAFRNPFAVLDAAHMGMGGADPAELMTAPLGPRGGGGAGASGGGSAFSFQAGVFPLPGLSFGWPWPPTMTATPRLVDENGGGQRIMMRDPHAVNRPPTRDEWLRAVVQQVFLAVFFAMFVAITFGG